MLFLINHCFTSHMTVGHTSCGQIRFVAYHGLVPRVKPNSSLDKFRPREARNFDLAKRGQQEYVKTYETYESIDTFICFFTQSISRYSLLKKFVVHFINETSKDPS
jgi:hypothetical protein